MTAWYRLQLSIHKVSLRDPVVINAALVVLSLVAVLTLTSQSAASYPTYLLALAMVATLPRWHRYLREPLVWTVGALLGYLVASSNWADPFDWRGFGSVCARALLVFCFVVAVGECVAKVALRVWLGRALVVAGSFAAAAGAWAFLFTPRWDGRLSGVGQLDTPIVAGLVWGVALIAVLDRLFAEASRPWRVAAALAVVLLVTAIVLSDSRNAWATSMLGAGCFCCAWLVVQRRRFWKACVGLGIIGALVLGALASSEATRGFVLPRGDSFRPAIWSGAVEATVADSAWFGRGILTDNDIPVAGARTFKHPHSLYLSVFYQGGALALLLLAAALAATVRILWRCYEQPDAKLAIGILALGLPAYLLDGHELIDKVGWTWFMLWLPVGIAVGLANSGEQAS